uniref:Uncharacterized protein n=1 Tax=Anguilla anguilla TaxID=7936 RepID=A0A0E9SB69_ANGAN
MTKSRHPPADPCWLIRLLSGSGVKRSAGCPCVSQENVRLR